MKTHIRSILLAAALCGGLFTLVAAEKGKAIATPKGGRLLEKTDPIAELVVEKDHGVTVNFHDAKLTPVNVAAQSVVVQADAREGKVKLEFEKKGDVLVSKTKLPAGDGYNVVVQFKQSAEARVQNFRFKLDLTTCGECKRPEYGCICDH